MSVQEVHLVHGSRETVEEKAGCAVLLGQPVGDDGLRHIVGNVLSCLDEGLDLDTQLGGVADVGAEDVSR